MGAVLKLFVGEAFFFAVAVRFDQACFRRKSRERILQRRADRFVFGKVQH